MKGPGPSCIKTVSVMSVCFNCDVTHDSLVAYENIIQIDFAGLLDPPSTSPSAHMQCVRSTLTRRIRG